MSKLHMPGGAEEVRSLLSMADTDGDGKIEPDEFIAWFEWRYQEQRKRGVVMIPGRNWMEGKPQHDYEDYQDPAPLDIKDGLGEARKGNVPTDANETLIGVGGLSRVITAMAVSKNDGFCSKNKELCSKNKELCSKIDECCSKIDEFCRC